MYLITYSNADTKVFDREKFSSAIVGSVQSASTSSVMQWACCMEQHKNGSYHFHMAVLLDKAQRWIRIEQHIQQQHTSSDHAGYHSAYAYVMKEDVAVLKSQNHPAVKIQPRTANATRARAGKGRKSVKKAKRLSNSEVAKIVLQNKIRVRIDLLALAKRQSQHRDTLLYDCVLNRSEKKLKELVLEEG